MFLLPAVSGAQKEFTLLGWKDECSAALVELDYGKGGSVSGGRVGTLSLERGGARALEDWRVERAPGEGWDAREADAAVEALARLGYVRTGESEQVRPGPGEEGARLDATLGSLESLHLPPGAAPPAPGPSLAELQYSPDGSCALLLLRVARGPGACLLARLPPGARRERCRAHAAKGLLLLKAGDTDAALGEFEAAAAADPGFARARYYRAALLARLGRASEALEELAAAVRLDGSLAARARAAREFEPLRRDPRFQEVAR